MPDKLQRDPGSVHGGSVVETPTGITVSPIAYPLDEFYAQAGRKLPRIEQVNGDAVPQPYRSLLVHNNDMTPTLEKFHDSRIHLAVVGRQQRGDLYCREVVLLNESDRPVEFGAIKINLPLFPPAARRQILEESVPLGQLLRVHDIVHASRPKAFLRIHADAFISEALRLGGERPVLYGRRNTLVDPVRRSLAEIVEILPPVTV